MYLFLAVFCSLIWFDRDAPLLEVLLWAICIDPAVFYLASLVGLPMHGHVALDVLAAAATIAALAWRWRHAGRRTFSWSLDTAVVVALALAAVAFFAWMLRNTFLLPGNDATAVATYARLVFEQGAIPDDIWPVGTEPFVYPPGYSILLSAAFSFGSPFAVLHAYKWAHVLVLALTPLGWAIALRRIFGFGHLRLSLVVVAFYAGFLLFDRTLLLAILAKNAQLLCALLFPFVFWGLVDPGPGRARLVRSGLAALGLCLIHYSALYMLSISLAAWLLVMGRGWWGRGWRPAVAFGGAVALLAPFLLELRTGRGLDLAPGTPTSEAVSPLGSLWFALTQAKSPTLFIFASAGVAWPYKGFAILTLVALGLAFWAWRRRRGREVDSAAWAPRAIFVLLLALATSVVLALGLIPGAGISWNYTRWFLYNFTAALAGIVLAQVLSGVWELSVGGRRWPVRALLAASGVALVLASALERDLDRVIGEIDQQNVGREEVAATARKLDRLAERKTCWLVTESTIGFKHRIVQPYRPLEYAYLVSGCAIVNGSWNARPLENSREVLAMPSRAFFSTKAMSDSKASRIIAVTSPELMEHYRRAIPEVGWRDTGEEIGPLRAYVRTPRRRRR